MDHSRATYEAYDGVELRLLNGRIARCPALTVQEASHYLRLLAGVGEDPSAYDIFLSEFPGRIGILDERITDLGLELAAPNGRPVEFGDLTLKDALALIDVIATALDDAFSVESSEAKVRILDELPLTLGVDANAGEVFTLARTFAEQLYLLMNGLAQDFLQHLTLRPVVKVMEIRAAGLAMSQPGQG